MRWTAPRMVRTDIRARAPAASRVTSTAAMVMFWDIEARASLAAAR